MHAIQDAIRFLYLFVIRCKNEGKSKNYFQPIKNNYINFRNVYGFITWQSLFQKLILEVIESSTKIPKSCLLLIRGYGLLSWLTETVIRLENCDAQYVTLLINIVSNILKALLCVKQEYDTYKILLLKILLSLKTRLTIGISIFSFEQYLSILQKLLVSKDLDNIVSKKDMKDIVEFSKNLIGKIDEYENMLDHGCEFVSKTENSNMENELEATRTSMRSLVWTWCRYRVR